LHLSSEEHLSLQHLHEEKLDLPARVVGVGVAGRWREKRDSREKP
jgi:hypothetical protein